MKFDLPRWCRLAALLAVAAIATGAAGQEDRDGDGYTEDNGDCNDDDPDIHWDAEELCDDDVDNDCDGAVDFQDYDCLAKAEEEAGIACHCDFPDPPEAVVARTVPWWPPLAMLAIWRIRRP